MPEIPIQNMMGGAIIIAGFVWALTEMLKRMPFHRDWMTAAFAMLLGPGLALGWTWAASPELTKALVAVALLTGLMGSLGAAGYYKLAQWSPPEQPPVDPPK